MHWDVQNAKKVTLETTDGDSELIPLNGEKKCSPDVSTTYTIKAMALDGITEVSKSVSIGVLLKVKCYLRQIRHLRLRKCQLL